MEGNTVHGTNAELIFDARNVVGESLIWVERDQALWWVDIGGHQIARLDWKTRRVDMWPTPGIVTSIGSRARGGFIVGLKSEVALWFPGGPFQPFARIEPNEPANRLNEGVVAPDGSFWVGTMRNNLTQSGEAIEITESAGAIWRVKPDAAVERVCNDAFGITNTFVWLDDGRFVTADTLANSLFSYGCDAQGRLGSRRLFAPPDPRGLPDGSCIDVEGYIWNCRVAGGACLVRYAPNGRIDRRIELPCSWPTSCAFAGPDYSTLCVTSARFTMTPDHLADHPWEGGVFAVDVGTRGRPQPEFLG
jgi:sugar lactone lactonase YvrE